MRFDPQYFKKFDVTEVVINQYWKNAERDLTIAEQDNFAEVRFTYAYQALVKAGITLIAKEGSVKVRSIPGHHVKVIDALARLLNDDDIKIIGHVMRKKRNLDLYEGGEVITKKEADDYILFVKDVMKRIQKRIK